MSTTSAADLPVAAWISVGMPRPLSTTDTLPSGWMVTWIVSQTPAMASSMALSTTS